MSVMAGPEIDIREAILRELKHNEFQAMELLVKLGSLGYADSDIKRAVSELIHEGKIELTPHRQVRVAESAA
ncbi:MAG: hypothetical protein WB523_11105 [Candidatus Sulfotelmatobacter sp.]